MAKNKKTPKQAMKYWWVGAFGRTHKIKARTARVALRKYLRGSFAHDTAVANYELERGPALAATTPREMLEERRDSIRHMKTYALSRGGATAEPY